METEKSKMLSGKYYCATDEELTQERYRAKVLLHRLNSASPSDEGERKSILWQLFGQWAESSGLEPPFRCDYGYNIKVGRNLFANYNLTILDCAPVTIGDNVLIGPNVGIYTATHPLEADLRNEGLEYSLPITIGDSVWIGGHVVINPGVTIGDRSVIGSGSVVIHDIPPDSVAVGNPCRVIRSIDNGSAH